MSQCIATVILSSDQALKERLAGRQGRRVRRKAHTLTQYRECEGLAEDVCYKKVIIVFFFPFYRFNCAYLACDHDFLLYSIFIYEQVLSVMEGFFQPRAFMWPTFAANGFNLFD